MLSRTIRALALSAVLAAGCTTSAVQEAIEPVALTPMEAAAAMYADARMRPETASAPFNIDGLNALLGEMARITYETSGLDETTGAYQLTGVRAELLGDEPLTLFTAEQVLLWNADIDGLAARLQGEGLDQALRLFDRIELSGVSMDLTEYTNTFEEAMSATLLEEGLEAPATEYDESMMTVGQIVLGGMTLHPWTFEDVEGQDEDIAALRLVAAFARSFSLETSYFADARTTQSFRQDDIESSMVTVYEHQIVQGYDRGDIGAMIQTGVEFSANIPVPVPAHAATEDESLPETTTPFLMNGTMDYSAWTGFSLATLLEWGERGELPPITETDLWSFGSYVLSGTEMDLGGKPFLRIGHLEASADQFAWFLPERITVRHEDAALHLADMLNAMAVLEPDTMTRPGEPSMAEIAGILERTGFGTLSGDGEFAFTWDSETGATLLENRALADGLFTDTARVAFTLPTYAALVPGFGIDGRSPDEDMLSDIVESNFAFIGGHYSLTDMGLLNGIASIVIEFAKLSAAMEDGPDGEGDMLAGFADSTPEALRSFAATMLLFSGGAVAGEIPGAEGWIPAISAFISEGGTLRIGFEPEAPLTAASLEPSEDGGMAETSLDFVEILGISVVHTPPPESEDSAEAAETP